MITANGEIYEVHGDLDTVNTSLLGDKMRGSINEHNHVTGESQYSFNWEDLEGSIFDGSKLVLAFDEKYHYYMVLPDKNISEDDVYDAKELSKEIVFNKNITGEADISSENLQHEMIKEVCNILGIIYKRTKK